MKIDTAKVLDVATKSPELVVTLLKFVASEAEKDPTLIPDGIAAVRAGTPLDVLAKHPGFVKDAVTVLISQATPADVGALLGALEHSAS